MAEQRDDQIRQRAYEIWEQEGRPDGREHAHWDEASRQVGGGAESPERRPAESGTPFEDGGDMPSGEPSVDQLTPAQATAAVTGRGNRQTGSGGSDAEARTRKPL